MMHPIIDGLLLFVVLVLVETFCATMRAMRWRPFYRRRDVIWIHGVVASEPEKAEASAKAIRESYDRAGLPRPVILTVPGISPSRAIPRADRLAPRRSGGGS